MDICRPSLCVLCVSVRIDFVCVWRNERKEERAGGTATRRSGGRERRDAAGSRLIEKKKEESRGRGTGGVKSVWRAEQSSASQSFSYTFIT